VGKTLLIAGLCSLIPLIGNVVASFVTVWTGAGSWLVVPIVGVVVAMVTALIQAYGSAAGPVPNHSPGQGQHPPSPAQPYPQKQRGKSLAAALLISFLVIGVGGWAVTVGVRYAVGYITGNEQGTERLVQPATSSSGGLTLTVDSVVHTDHFTRVGVAALNETGSSLSLPLSGFCVFVGGDGTTLKADAFRSRWSETLAPGIRQRGTINFDGHIPKSVKRASLSFTQIFGPGGGSITVPDIMLRPGEIT
jgi:hypothetical protein